MLAITWPQGLQFIHWVHTLGCRAGVLRRQASCVSLKYINMLLMDQEQIIAKIVSAFKEEPRNKIIISCGDLCLYASEELGRELSAESLAKAVATFEEGEATEADESIVDAATSLCHQVSKRCWGECLDVDEDEWSEVDISTEWSDYDSETASDLFVTVYQD